MSQLATMRALSCGMKRCHSLVKVQKSVMTRNQDPLRSRTALNNTSRFKSTSAPPSRQQSTAFASPQAMSGATHQQHVARTSLRDRLSSFLLKPRTLPVPRWVSPQHYTVTLSEVCGHMSFVLVAVSYAVDDFLELRILAVAGSTAMLFFTYFHPHGRVLWLPFKWNALFIAINSYRIGNVFMKRFHAEQLPQELLSIHQDHFYVLDPVDFYKLVQLGRMETFKPGDLVVAQVS